VIFDLFEVSTSAAGFSGVSRCLNRFFKQNISKPLENKELIIERFFKTNRRLVHLDVVDMKHSLVGCAIFKLKLVSANDLLSFREWIAEERIRAVSEDLRLVVCHQFDLHHAQQSLLGLQELLTVKVVVSLSKQRPLNFNSSLVQFD
jgi:hypothetical protein